MKNLHLNVTKEWFDMILSGIKPEEYRSITEYWKARLVKEWLFLNEEYAFQSWTDIPKKPIFFNFDTITFSNGFAKDRRQFVIECKGIEINTGNEKWGAKKEQFYFVIKLGNILSTKNIICQNLENVSVSM